MNFTVLYQHLSLLSEFFTEKFFVSASKTMHIKRFNAQAIKVVRHRYHEVCNHIFIELLNRFALKLDMCLDSLISIFNLFKCTPSSRHICLSPPYPHPKKSILVKIFELFFLSLYLIEQILRYRMNYNLLIL